MYVCGYCVCVCTPVCLIGHVAGDKVDEILFLDGIYVCAYICLCLLCVDARLLAQAAGDKVDQILIGSWYVCTQPYTCAYVHTHI